MPQIKRLIADTLVELLQTTRMDNITVKDIAIKCGISRQTFYYYFDDIYDVLEWVFEQETDKAWKAYSSIDNWQVGYLRMLKWAYGHKALVKNIYNSIRRDYIELFMNRVMLQYLHPMVIKEAEGMQVSAERQEYIANFYTLALNAASLDWIRNNMKETPEAVAQKVAVLVKGSFRRALQNFQAYDTDHTTL